MDMNCVKVMSNPGGYGAVHKSRVLPSPRVGEEGKELESSKLVSKKVAGVTWMGREGNNNASSAKTKLVKTSTPKIFNSIKSKGLTNAPMNKMSSTCAQQKSNHSHSYQTSYLKNIVHSPPPPSSYSTKSKQQYSNPKPTTTQPVPSQPPSTPQQTDRKGDAMDAGEGDSLLRALPYDKKVAKTLPTFPTFSVGGKPRHDKRGATTPKLKHYPTLHQGSRRGAKTSVPCRPTQDSSCQSLHPKAGDKINVEIRAQSAKEYCPNYLLKDTENEKIIEELFNAASSSRKQNKSSVVAPSVSPLSSTTSSSSNLHDLQRRNGRNKVDNSGCKQNDCMAFERVQYRVRLEEILEQPVKELVSFSKGVILLKHENHLEGILRLTNLSSEPISIRATSNITPRYKIEPRLGLIEPDKFLALRISTKQLYTPAQIKRDKFFIESAIIDEWPRSHKQILEFWKTISTSRVQKAQTNVTFIFHSDDPKFREILGGETVQKRDSKCRVLSESMPLASEHSNSFDEMTKSSSCTPILADKKSTQKNNNPNLSITPSKVRAGSTNTPTNNHRQMFFSFLQACPLAAGFMFFIYHALTKN